MRRRCWLLILLVACGRHGFDEIGDAGRPFGMAAPLDELNTLGMNDDPTLTADELEIYWESTRTDGAGAENIWRARRSSTAVPFGTPELVSELDSAAEDGSPGISADGLTLVFTSRRAGALGFDDLFLTTRPSRGAPWTTPPIHLIAASSSSRDTAPAISDDGLEIWFQSDRAGPHDLYVIRRASSSESFAMIAATRVDELATAAVNGAPFLWRDQRIYFHSERQPTAGGKDLWIVDYDKTTGTFGAAERMLDTASAIDDEDPWVAPDGNTIYFSRDKVIVRATRP